jgi:hypothetical protein
MATNLAIDPKLLEKALTLGGQRTKRATVNEALTEYIQRRLRLKAVEHFGTFDFDFDPPRRKITSLPPTSPTTAAKRGSRPRLPTA